MLSLLAIACCCGCPGYVGWPAWQQYPAAAALPGTIADLNRRSDAASQRAEAALHSDMLEAHLLAEEAFAGLYADRRGKRVLVFGATGFWLRPRSDLEAELTRLDRTYRLDRLEAVEAGERGTYQQCGTGRADGEPVVVCGWADHGSLGAAVFTRRSLADSAELLRQIRGSIIRRG